MKLTVIYADVSNLKFANENPTHRSVTIELTKEQEEILQPRMMYYENIGSKRIEFLEWIVNSFIESDSVETTREKTISKDNPVF